MLADVGLTRIDLHVAHCEPLWRDPTSILKRRISDRGAAFELSAQHRVRSEAEPRMSLAEIWLSERERRRAKHALHDAEAIVDAMMWVKERVAALGAMLLKPGFKH